MFSAFRKPRRGAIRNRNRDSNSSDSEQENDDIKDVDDSNGRDDVGHLEAIAKFKEKKNKAGRKKNFITESSSTSNNGNDSPIRVRSGASSLLSFGDDEGEDGEVFQVKKSSVSRRIIKQKKAEKKKGHDSNNGNDQDPEPVEAGSRKANATARASAADDELEIRVKDNIPRPVPAQSWTLTGREAEALHMEEEEEEDDDEAEEPNDKSDKSKASQKEPLRKLLQSGAIPDAAAIHEARKRRQAARERGDAGAAARDYIPVEKDRDEANKRDKRDRSESDDDDEGRISFTGVRSDAKDRQLRQQQLHSALRGRPPSSDEDDRAPDDWEEQQIRKAMGGMQVDSCNNQTSQQANLFADSTFAESRPKGNKSKLVALNLQGVRDHLKERLSSMTEVNRRHQSDEDRAVDELISSQSEIERLEAKIPDLTERHKFYQDLRGYVTDLVECFNEKIVNIQYLEDKYYKSKSEISASLMERRREDVRDQMLELSSKPGATAADAAADAARQRRAAEREGRRRRRLQQRVSKPEARGGTHNDGLSSDEELSTTDEAKRRTARQDVEIQARQVLADVVEDFASISGVKARLEEWKECDADSYGDAYVSLCLPKIFAPLVRLQMLFWNPFAEQNDFERMEWYRTLATFSWDSTETESSLTKDPDRGLVALLVERVVVPKLTSLVEAEFDPMSTTQTVRLTSLVNRLTVEYPTLTGFSKPMRALLQAAREKLKNCVDGDLYVPIGYSKQITDNPSGSHAAFANRQFWACFKLFRNILSWQGLMTDELLSELALNAVLNRYLLIALGVNPNCTDALAKSKQIVAVLPSEWKERGSAREQLKRLANYLATLGNSLTGQRATVNEVFSLLKVIGYGE